MRVVKGQKNGEYVAMKAQNGSDLCATWTPDSSQPVSSKLDCYRHCLASGCLCASGANYREKEKLCEMYSIQPGAFTVVPDCTFYQVWFRVVILGYFDYRLYYIFVYPSMWCFSCFVIGFLCPCLRCIRPTSGFSCVQSLQCPQPSILIRGFWKGKQDEKRCSSRINLFSVFRSILI